MSIGGLVGAVVGGVIGFVVTGGNPLGAFYGASLGFALGMIIDPMTPDVPSVGAPHPPGESVMSGEVGISIADLAGTAKIVGHLLCYGGERAEPVYGKTSGGGGKGGIGGGGPPEPEPQITGYRYYMSWAVGIVAGQADTLYAIYKNDEVIWEGTLDCPASGGEETITLDGMGSAVFYFGTDDHALNSKAGVLLDDATLNTPYRHLCWCFLDDCYIGEYNRAPTMKFIVKKIPEYGFSTKHEIQTYDCNPAHAMWYILHDLTSLPESWLHSSDFAAIASTLWGEGRGLSILFSSQQSALNYLESINAHIDSILRYGTDGKFHPKLIRDDYTVGDLPTIDEDVMLEEPSFDRRSWIDTLNEMKVQYSEIIDVRSEPERFFFGTGRNIVGELGLGDNNDRNVFTKVGFNVKTFACGGAHQLLINKDDDILWATGSNSYGQLGLGDNDNRNVFTRVGSDKWKMVACGTKGDCSLAIRNDDTLWVTGDNGDGELGLGGGGHRNVFTQVGSDTWKYISGGKYTSFAIKDDDTLWGTGDNDYYQLGLGDYNDRDVFTKIGSDKWKQVSGGSYNTFAIKDDDTLWGTGYNNYGELGLGDYDERDVFTKVGSDTWKQVACGDNHTLAIKSDDTLWATGKNSSGELGLDDDVDRNVFTQVGSDKWKYVACGDNQSIAIKSDNTLWATGWNFYGQLGLGNNDSVDVFTQVGSDVWAEVACGEDHSAARII